MMMTRFQQIGRVLVVWVVFAGGPSALGAQPAPSAALRTELDLLYVAGGGHKQQLDLYLPAGKGFPTILFVHGGSLIEGDRKDAPYPMIGQAFQKTGVGCAVMSYRLGPENRWPAQPRDVAAAFEWLKKNIETRGGDPRKIFLVGHSSGAHLVAIVSADEKYLRESGFAARDVAGCIPMGALLNTTWNLDGGSPEEHWSEEFTKKTFQRNSTFRTYRSVEVYRDANPSNHIGPHLPPFLILVAETERFQPPILSQAEAFVTAVTNAGGKATVEILKDRTHLTTIKNMITPDDPTVRRIVQFIKGQ